MSIPFDPTPIPVVEDKFGIYRISGTRLSLDLIVGAFNNGLTCEEIVMQYPSLKLSDAYLVVSFYLNNKKEIDLYISKNKKEAERLHVKLKDNQKAFTLRNILTMKRGKLK